MKRKRRRKVGTGAGEAIRRINRQRSMADSSSQSEARGSGDEAVGSLVVGGQRRRHRTGQGSGSWMCVYACLSACASRCVLGDPRIPAAVDVVDVGVGECGLGDMDIGGWRADNRPG